MAATSPASGAPRRQRRDITCSDDDGRERPHVDVGPQQDHHTVRHPGLTCPIQPLHRPGRQRRVAGVLPDSQPTRGRRQGENRRSELSCDGSLRPRVMAWRADGRLLGGWKLMMPGAGSSGKLSRQPHGFRWPASARGPPPGARTTVARQHTSFPTAMTTSTEARGLDAIIMGPSKWGT